MYGNHTLRTTCNRQYYELVRSFAVALATLVVTSGCGRIGFDSLVEPGSPEEPLELTVTPVYENAANWAEYVANVSPAASALEQTGAPCDTWAEGDASTCIHAGELRRVFIPELSTCEGLQLRDQLDVFHWRCLDDSGEVEFFSALGPGRGLRHLVSADAWLDNRVLLSRDEEDIGSSALETWFSNPIRPLPDNSTGPAMELTEAGTVYVLAH